MSGYLQRIASSVLTPSGAIHPVLGSVFSASTYRRKPKNSPAENDVPSSNRSAIPVTPQQGEGVPPTVWKESVTPPPTARIHPRAIPVPGALASEVPPVPTATSASDRVEHKREAVPEERTFFKPLVDKGKQREIDRPSVPSFTTDYEPGRLEESKGALSKNRNELFKSSQEAARVSQSARLDPGPSVDKVPPSQSVTSASEGRTSFKPLVIKAQQRNVAEPDVELSSRDKPLAAESFSRADQPAIFREASALLTPDARKREKRDLSHHSSQPQREPDEIQIHIGRIEVVAVSAAPAPSAALKAQRGAPSLDEYLRRRDRKTV